jgi:DNA-binding NtrC family response regulator
MILLIDDSDHERALIRKMLESGGHEVREATGGDEGIGMFGTLAPSLVLCDLMMPFKDGFATIADMQTASPEAKIIAMSGVWYGKADHDAMARDLGLVAVIEKPFDRVQLLEIVANALNPKPKVKRKAKAKREARPKAKAGPKVKAKRRPKAKPMAKRRRR